MQLNDAQKVTLQGIAGSPVAKVLEDVITAYINELKDEVIFGELEREVAKAAIGKLQEFGGKLGLIQGKQAKPDTTMFI